MAKTATTSAVASGAARPSGSRAGLDRDEVVAKALDLVVREGSDALTMRRLATELAVGTPTIYWHVGSREDLVSAVVRAQAELLAERPVTGETPRERVLSAARHIYAGAIENRAITSLAHQTGTDSLLLHDLEAVLVSELEAAGLTGEDCAAALRSILVVVTGALVLTLRDVPRLPVGLRDQDLWAGSDADITTETRAILEGPVDLDALTTATLAAVVDHHVPPATGPGPSTSESEQGET
jgi:AcrR family transcriptional regulator